MVNTTAALMALPAPLEQIRLVGDEDKHATLMFFGETSSLPVDAKTTLTDAVKLASSMLFPFSEVVREVSRLGSENPPALVAMLSDRNLSQIRNLFMMNPAVSGYLSNTQQFSSFTPHVTLGFPDFTDEAILRALASQLYRVRFDRLAVWWNDERIEFPLSGPWNDGGDDVAMMSDAIENFLAHADVEVHLEHHGVRGMKWGVRRPRDPSTGLVKKTGGLIPRKGSEDSIHQQKIASKLAKHGTSALSNKELKDFTDRIRLEQDFRKATSSEEAKKGRSWINNFIRAQGGRQFDRVANKAIDIAVEQAITKAGVKIGANNPELGSHTAELAKRLKPKKK